MSHNVATLLKEAVKLPKRSRARLAARIMQSIDVEEKLQLGAKLAQARLDAVDRGEMETYPADEVIEAVLARKARRKP